MHNNKRKLAKGPVFELEKEIPTFLDKLLLLDKQAKKGPFIDWNL